MIVDDPAPCINLAYYEQYFEPHVRDVPNTFTAGWAGCGACPTEGAVLEPICCLRTGNGAAWSVDLEVGASEVVLAF